MGLGRIGRVVALGGLLVVAVTACDRSKDVTIITATPVCPVVANATAAMGTVATFNQISLTLTTVTNATIVVHYQGNTHFARLTAFGGALKAGMRVQALVQATAGGGIPAALTVIQQPPTGGADPCAASQGTPPGVVGTITSVLANGQQFTLTDDAGKQYVLAVTATTSLTQMVAAQQGDIATGERVLVSGTGKGSSIAATQITITTNAY